MFEQLPGLLPVDMEFRQTGGLVVIESEAELEAMKAYVKSQRETGLEVLLLDADEARHLEPNLAENIVGAAWSPMNGQVNRRPTLSGLKSIAARASIIIPRLTDLNLVRSFAGLRPYTPDGLINGRPEVAYRGESVHCVLAAASEPAKHGVKVEAFVDRTPVFEKIGLGAVSKKFSSRDRAFSPASKADVEITAQA